MPYIRVGKCVYKKNADGSRGKKVGCSDTVAQAEAHRRALYAAAAKEEQKTTIFLTRAADGQRLIGLLSSNAYFDSDGDAAALESLQSWVEREWQGDAYTGKGVVLFWHDGEPIADIVYSAVEGAFLVEIAKARQTPFADAIFDGIERLSGNIDFGASIGAWTGHVINDRHVFHVLDKPETSTLPADFAANLMTHTEIMKMNTAQKLVRRLWLRRHIPEASKIEEKLRETADQATHELDEKGLERKADSTAGLALILDEIERSRMLDVESLSTSLTELVGELLGEKVPEDLSTRISTQIETHITDAGIDDEAMSAYEEEKGIQKNLVDMLSLLTDELAAFSDLETQVEKMASLPDAVQKQLTPVVDMQKALLDVNARLERVEAILKGEVKPASRSAKTTVEKDEALVSEALAKANRGDPGDPWNGLLKNTAEA